jgi:hypothetical protein
VIFRRFLDCALNLHVRTLSNRRGGGYDICCPSETGERRGLRTRGNNGPQLGRRTAVNNRHRLSAESADEGRPGRVLRTAIECSR